MVKNLPPGRQLHLLNPDVTAAAALALHHISFFESKPGADDVIDLGGHTLEFIRQVVALNLNDTPRTLLENSLQVVLYEFRNISHPSSPIPRAYFKNFIDFDFL
ncbi:hypothetical protein D3C81_1776710 [compost metagenome]